MDGLGDAAHSINTVTQNSLDIAILKDWCGVCVMPLQLFILTDRRSTWKPEKLDKCVALARGWPRLLRCAQLLPAPTERPCRILCA